MKKGAVLFLSLIIVISFTACLGDNTQKSGGDVEDIEIPKTRVIVDAYGREVEIPSKIDSIICTGSGALRMVSYLEATDLLVGIEEGDTQYETSTKRDYAYVYHDLFKSLPAIGKGGGTAYTAYPEEIIKISPDVILCGYSPDALDQLAKETGIPVVAVRYESIGFVDDSFYNAMEIIGDVLDRKERCEEVLSYIDSNKEDLHNRTKLISEKIKLKVYTGAVTFSGAHGFSGTYSNFGPFMGINALNVADEMGKEGYFDADLEKVTVWDPDIIFLDPGNMNLVNEEYKTNPNFFSSLKAVQNKSVYTMPSFNNYSTNITYALMDSYFAGKVLYPNEFSDIDMKDKGNEILEELLGHGYFDEMESDGLYFGQIIIGE